MVALVVVLILAWALFPVIGIVDAAVIDGLVLADRRRDGGGPVVAGPPPI